MADTMFPFINYSEADLNTSQVLAVPAEYAWDFENDCPLLIDGKWGKVTENQAIKIWAMKALRTKRYKYLAYSPDYGQEFENLIGKGITQKNVLAQAQQYLHEALMLNPYIKSISDTVVSIESDRLTIECTLKTPYGEVNLNV